MLNSVIIMAEKSKTDRDKLLKKFSNRSGHLIIFNSWNWSLIHGTFSVNKFLVLYMYYGTVQCNLGPILVLTSDLCRQALAASFCQNVLMLSLSVNCLHKLIYVNPILTPNCEKQKNNKRVTTKGWSHFAKSLRFFSVNIAISNKYMTCV